MKKLYALLVILIIIYIVINVGAGGLNFLNTEPANVTDDTNESNGITIGDNSFPEMENFTATKINDTAVSLKDSKKNIVINISEIDNGNDISEIAVNSYFNGGTFTSNQTIDQNGVPVYLLYNEGTDSYGADIYFNKDNQNYMITGSNIGYENSDYFIDHCKQIIDTLGSGSSSNEGYSRW